MSIRETGQLSGNSELMLIKANVATPFRADDLVTPRKAYSEVVDRTAQDISSHYGFESRRFRQIVTMMPVSEVIEPNIHFDEVKTQTAVKQKVDNLSLYSGKVCRGNPWA